MKLRLAIAALLLFLGWGGIAAAQECREPTPQERAAVTKAATVLQQTIVVPLSASHWRVIGEESAFTKQIVVATHADPPRPLFDCTALFEVRLQADSGNKYAAAAQAAMQSLGANSSQSDIKRIAAIAASAKIEIRAVENVPTLGAEHTPLKRLIIRGVPVAYQVADERGGDGTVTTTLCYGRFDSFAHRAGTPFIENLCVHVCSTPAVMNELLKEVRWSSLNQALTK